MSRSLAHFIHGIVLGFTLVALGLGTWQAFVGVAVAAIGFGLIEDFTEADQ